jgi:serine/threonine protein kinase
MGVPFDLQRMREAAINLQHQQLYSMIGEIRAEVEANEAWGQPRVDFLQTLPHSKSMDLRGKNLSGYYTIRTKLGEDLFSEIWEVKPIFSALELYGFFFKKPVSDFHSGSTSKLRSYIRETFNLQHPNLVNVFESDVFEGRVYILTEKVQGFRLADYLASKDFFTLSETLSIVYELLTALVYLHRRGLGQNLVNPQTVWIAPQQPFQNRIRIACFGYQFSMGEAFLKTERGYSSVTAYLAPEVRRSSEKTVDFQSDLYSVGVIFYRLLTGELPEKVGSREHQPMPVVQADKVLREKEVPRDIRKLVILLMKIRVSRRVNSAETMTEAILSAIRRYTFREHGEVDAKAYLNDISRKNQEGGTQGEPPPWNLQSVFGKRTQETLAAEGTSYQERNLYFAKLVQEFMNSKTKGSMEWTQNPFPPGTPRNDPVPMSFVDEVRVAPATFLETSQTETSHSDAEEELEWLPVSEEPLDTAEQPEKRLSGWRIWLLRIKRFFQVLFKR